MPDRDRPLYAVLIDADNIPAKFAEDILKEVTGLGEPALRRVYGDWSDGKLKSWKEKAKELGLVTHQDSANTTQKNASDIGLVIDAMDILHSGRFDGFVLVSSDSDFTALANRVREQGMDVIGIGEAKTPESLRNVCNRFILIQNIVEQAATESGPASAKKNPSAALRKILAAMDKIDQEDDWYTLGRIGQQIQADDPAFDTRSYGKRKLSDLVVELKRLETKRVGTQLHVRRLD